MNVFELMAVLGLDTSQYDDGLKNAENKAQGFGSGLLKGLGKTVATGAKLMAGAVTAAAGVTGAFATSAVKSYAEYEQLVGGVDKLYGEASGRLQAYANDAYLTAGMSANAYMETATSFSAALINGLGGDTKKAADITDVAMRAMSDNVNTFGSSMESVQMAFMGFSKQNYTMLDNLKLGYGGTKTEMERLIADANEYRKSIGQTADLSIDSFADIVQAIQSVQEKQHIAGTTNKEAMKTIEGSANATKAAWENVITAIGRGEGLEQAMQNLVTSVFGAAEGEGLVNQIIPRIESVFGAIGTFVEGAAPYITEKLPGLAAAVIPQLLQTGMTMVKTVGGAIPGLLKGLITSEATAGLITNIVKTVKGVVSTVATQLPSLMDNLIQGDTFAGFIEKFTDGLREGVTNIIPVVMEYLVGFTTSLRENVGILVDAGLDMVMALRLSRDVIVKFSLRSNFTMHGIR